MKASLRPSKAGDEPRLKELWKLSFFDEDRVPNDFFETLYYPGMATLLEKNGRLASAVYSLGGASLLFPGANEMKCAYLYCLATVPEHRGGGFGAEVIRESAASAYAQGCDFVCFLPASESLCGWYRKILGAQTRFWAREMRVSEADAPARGEIFETSPKRYNELREELLKGYPHASFDLRLIGWQARLSGFGGGGLYEIRLPGLRGCAAAEIEGNGELFIRELLVTDNRAEKAAALIARFFGRKSCLARTPAHIGDGALRDFTMVVPAPDGRELPVNKGAYWGPAFD